MTMPDAPPADPAIGFGAPPELVGRTIERGVSVRKGIIELAQDWEAAFRDDWGENTGRVRVQRGRIGLVSAARRHRPELQLSAYDAGPPPVDDGPDEPLAVLGTWLVIFPQRTVEVWGGDLVRGDTPPLRLPPSRGGRYLVRVSVGYRDLAGEPLKRRVATYRKRHGEQPSGLERFVADFWPDPFAAPVPSSAALRFEPEPIRPTGYRELPAPSGDGGTDESTGLFDQVVEHRVSAGHGPIEIAEVRAAARDGWGRDRGLVRIQRGRVGLVSAASDHRPEIQLSAYTAEPSAVEIMGADTVVPLGTWPVRFERRRIEVWSDAADSGRGRPLRLPTAKGGRYWMRVVAVYPDLGPDGLTERLRQHRGQDGRALAGWEQLLVDLWPASRSAHAQRDDHGSSSEESVGPVSRLIERKVDAGYRSIVIATDGAGYDEGQWGDGPVRIQPDRIELESASDLHAPEVQVSAYLAEPPPVESPSEVPMETLGVWPITIHDHELRVWSLDGTPGKKTVTLPKVKDGRYLVRVAVGYRSTGGLSLDDYAIEYYERHGTTVRGMERFVVDLWPAR
ncbi:hypothetical protein [Micropruina sp.]|uniref:hypothetical protein n=1 Tax=Micropruina sp. TaxID=2737536 RepID=UPI0026149429|nr:hypothetical protein [Micropruina sp.]